MVLFLLTGFLSCACVPVNKLSFSNKVDVKSLRVANLGTLEVVVSVSVKNNAAQDIFLTGLKGELKSERTKAAGISIEDEIRMEAGKRQTLEVPVRIKLEDPLELLPIALNSMDTFFKKLKVSGTATFRSGASKRTIKVNNVPVEDLLKYIEKAQ